MLTERMFYCFAFNTLVQTLPFLKLVVLFTPPIIFTIFRKTTFSRQFIRTTIKQAEVWMAIYLR